MDRTGWAPHVGERVVMTDKDYSRVPLGSLGTILEVGAAVGRSTDIVVTVLYDTWPESLVTHMARLSPLDWSPA